MLQIATLCSASARFIHNLNAASICSRHWIRIAWHTVQRFVSLSHWFKIRICNVVFKKSCTLCREHDWHKFCDFARRCSWRSWHYSATARHLYFKFDSALTLLPLVQLDCGKKIGSIITTWGSVQSTMMAKSLYDWFQQTSGLSKPLSPETPTLVLWILHSKSGFCNLTSELVQVI